MYKSILFTVLGALTLLLLLAIAATQVAELYQFEMLPFVGFSG